MRGYWKLNNNLLKDQFFFNDQVKGLVIGIFSNNDFESYGSKWEYFKYKARLLAINRSKALKVVNADREADMLIKINTLIKKENLSVIEIG